MVYGLALGHSKVDMRMNLSAKRRTQSLCTEKPDVVSIYLGGGGYWAGEDCHMPMYRISAGGKKPQLYVIKLIKGR